MERPAIAALKRDRDDQLRRDSLRSNDLRVERQLLTLVARIDVVVHEQAIALECRNALLQAELITRRSVQEALHEGVLVAFDGWELAIGRRHEHRAVAADARREPLEDRGVKLIRRRAGHPLHELPDDEPLSVVIG